MSTGLKPIQHLIDEISLDVTMDENGNEESAEEKDIFICTFKAPFTNEQIRKISLINSSIFEGPTKILIPSFTGNDVLNPPENI